jgi:hypothetical protein
MSAPTALKKAEEAPLDNNVQLPVQDTDEDFLLDAPVDSSADANVLVPVEESNEDGMQIDEEGRPRFAPARDIVRTLALSYVFHVFNIFPRILLPESRRARFLFLLTE